jgi:hypothetical protein
MVHAWHQGLVKDLFGVEAFSEGILGKVGHAVQVAFNDSGG